MKKEWKAPEFKELDICETASATKWMPMYEGPAMSGNYTVGGPGKGHGNNNGNAFGHGNSNGHGKGHKK